MNVKLPTVERPPDFRDLQFAFAAHIRDPQHQPQPADVENRRMAIYRELLYNNIEGFLSSAFPVLRSITTDEDWHTMVHDFFACHRSRTPYFMEIPQEFLSYLESERDNPGDPPYLLELAHYEWVELALEVSDDTLDLEGVDSDGNLLDQVPILSPLAWPLRYNYAVHRIGPDYRPSQPEQTHLVVYRDREDGIGFLEVNPVTMRLLQFLSEGTQDTGRTLLARIATELDHPNPQVVIQGGLSILQDLLARDVLLGGRA